MVVFQLGSAQSGNFPMFFSETNPEINPLIQGAMKPEISAAQSGGDNSSPMQSPVIATTSGLSL